MTTTQSPTAEARPTRNATETTPETFARDAEDVTEIADQLLGHQVPTVEFTQGVERYFEFIQKAVDVNRELATNWADAVTTLAGVVREQADKAGQLVTEQSERSRDVTIAHADNVQSATREQTDKFEAAEKTPASRDRQATNGHTNGIGDQRDGR